MKTRLLPFAAVATIALCGCGTSMRYLEYTGHDTSYENGSWPRGGGTMAETSYKIPVYRGWPEKPYRVLGSLNFEDANANWDAGIIKDAVSEARKRNADAIIIRHGAEWGVSKIAGERDAFAWGSNQTTALVVRWLTEQEINERERRLNEMLARLSTFGIIFSPNRTVAQQVVGLVLQQGIKLDSEAGIKSFTDTMRRLVATQIDSLAGEWVFQTRVSSGSSITGNDEGISNGLATISIEGENVSLVSNTGRVELNFSGTLSKGRLSGQLGVGSVTAKCEGAATPDKISVSFQSRSPDGVIQGSIVLQRLLQKPLDNEKINTTPTGKRT